VDLYTLNVSNDDISPKIQSNFSALKRTYNLQAGQARENKIKCSKSPEKCET
jgi:hypothetical protein